MNFMKSWGSCRMRQEEGKETRGQETGYRWAQATKPSNQNPEILLLTFRSLTEGCARGIVKNQRAWPLYGVGRNSFQFFLASSRPECCTGAVGVMVRTRNRGGTIYQKPSGNYQICFPLIVAPPLQAFQWANPGPKRASPTRPKPNQGWAQPNPAQETKARVSPMGPVGRPI